MENENQENSLLDKIKNTYRKTKDRIKSHVNKYETGYALGMVSVAIAAVIYSEIKTPEYAYPEDIKVCGVQKEYSFVNYYLKTGCTVKEIILDTNKLEKEKFYHEIKPGKISEIVSYDGLFDVVVEGDSDNKPDTLKNVRGWTMFGRYILSE
ncbi:MAG: hypothetical protein ACP5N3_02675 [Candidatus Nanoarchaeia archaeon]